MPRPGKSVTGNAVACGRRPAAQADEGGVAVSEGNVRQAFKLHLPGLLKVLAEHLYSNKTVAIRELLQNAHDSCLRRAVEGRSPGYRPRIDIAIDRRQGVLTISDNGSGLTADDITDYLATIGRSYTRELKEKLAFLAPDEAAQLIGQFGFGFLSSFLIALEVTLTTRSHRPGSEAIRWHCVGDEYYDLAPATRAEAGTTIELSIKPSAAFLLQEQLLNEAIRKYADFLPIPIHVNDDPVPVNLMTPPWETADPRTATLDYIERTFKLREPLYVLPLSDHRIDLGHDTLTVPLQGFLFVPPVSTASVQEYGDLAVFIRRMFIRDGEKDLLPPWARFVRGVIDCPSLQPTASREGLHQDERFGLVQRALEEQLSAGLRRVAREEPTVWRGIVYGHADVITGWAVSDNEFFAQVADIVTFRTSRGRLALPEYLQLTGGTLYYVSKELGSLQEQLLAEGHDVPVIDASWFAVEPFLQRYAARHPGIGLVQMDGEAQHLLRPVPEAGFAALLARYRARGIRTRVAAFKSVDVPALMLYPQGAEFIIETNSTLADGGLPAPLAGLVGDYLNRAAMGEDELKGTLQLNASCALIRRLADAPPADPALDAVLTLIHQIARLFAGRTLTAADAALAFRETVGAIEGLLA